MNVLLPLLVFLPFLMAGMFALLPKEETPAAHKTNHTFALICAVALFILSLFTVFGGGNALAFTQPWLPSLGINLSLGMDGISATLTMLTTLLMVLACGASASTIEKRLPLYYSMLFILIGSVLGVFLSRDLFLFFLFFELELIPMYLLISNWGGPRREYASMKFVLYTLFGSIFLVASMIGLAFFSHAFGFPTENLFAFDQLRTLAQSGAVPPIFQILLFLGFFIAFAVKLPVVPFHTWLPDAHVEAPTPISMLLAGILLKMGAYGLLRFGFDWFPLAAQALTPYIGVLAAINIIYTGSVALVQTDMKKLIAYSSVSHMGFILLALVAMNQIGTMAAVFIMVSHGLVSAALFLGVGTIYRQTHSREIAAHSGIAQKAPFIFYSFLLMSLSSLGLPLLVSFAGETLALYGGFLSTAFRSIPLGFTTLPIDVQWITGLSVFGVVIGAAYSLSLVKRLFFGPVSEACLSLKDARTNEKWVLGALTVLVIGLGIQPKLLTRQFEQETAAMGQGFEQVLFQRDQIIMQRLKEQQSGQKKAVPVPTAHVQPAHATAPTKG
jgi:NADH-quinone oxidoreductase subunit M